MKRILQLVMIAAMCIGSVFALETSPKREFRAVWLSTVVNIDWPKSLKDSDAKKQNDLKAYLVKLKDSGCNAVLFQVRCACDAMYDSPYEPWSYWFSGTQGEGPSADWDPLAFAVREAHALGMELHAWVNPYRAVVSPQEAGTNAQYISDDHITRTHPEWILEFSDVHILDPGLPQVRDYITDVLMDIVIRYDVDGLHMDDYFYPYSGVDNEDASTYSDHSRGIGDIHDWRRDNINLLVRSVMDSINAVKPWVKWGISPFGIYRPNIPPGISGMDAYNVLYCDPLAWLEDGSVDYLTPQCYWPFGGGQDYGKLIPWWAEQAGRYDRHFYPGQAMYRAGNSDFPRGEIPRQIRLNRATEHCGGSVFFTASDFYDNHKNTIDSLRRDLYRDPALWPVMSWKDSTAPSEPQNAEFLVDGAEAKILSWDAPAYSDGGDSAYAYMIYRAPYPLDELSDMSRSKAFLFHHEHRFTDPDPGMYYYALTSLDRCKLESVPAEMTFPFVDLQHPGYAEGAADKDPLFSWSPYAGSSQYTLQISGSDDLSEPLYEYTLSDTGRIVNLDYQTQYFWRVRSDNSEQWSPLWTFTTELPPAVEILFPPDYYEGIDPEVSRFTWAPLEDAVSYELKLASDPEMQDIILHEENIADTSLDIGGLEHGIYYYWQLRSGKYDRWTDVRKFKTREAHIATLWQRSMMTQSMPYYMDTELQAGGLALGDHDGNTLLYVLHSDSGDASVSVVDAESGDALYMTLDLSGVSGGTYALRDIAVAEDGRIYAVNCADRGESFKLYRWADSAGPAECVYTAENVAYRLGDHITLSGSEATGDLTLYAPAARSDKLLKLRWQSVSNSFDAQQITLGRGNSSNPDLALLPDDEGFYINSTEYYLRYFGSDGTFLDWMKGNTSLSPSANAIDGFSLNGKNYIAAYDCGTESAQIIDLTDGIRTALFAGSTCRLGIEENAECRGDVEVADNGDGTFTLYVMGERNGIGAYVFDAASAMTGIGETAAVPGFSLDENYPNPFNPVTRIPYSLDKDREIEILLYDLSGRKVKTLYRGKQQGGTHTLRFDAADLSSGVYICTLRSGDRVQTRKMTLLK